MIVVRFPVSSQTPGAQEQGRRNAIRNENWILDGVKNVKMAEAPGPDHSARLRAQPPWDSPGDIVPHGSLLSALRKKPGQSVGRVSRAQSQEPQCLCLLLALELGTVSEFLYASLFSSKMRIILIYPPRRDAEEEEWMNVRHLKQYSTPILIINNIKKKIEPMRACC